MKNVLILMLGLVAGTASFAQTTESKTPATSVSITSDQKLSLRVGPENANATVILRDANGHVLYSDNVSLHNGLQQKFNLTELGEGAYQLAVSVGKDTILKTFVIENQPAQKVVALRS